MALMLMLMLMLMLRQIQSPRHKQPHSQLRHLCHLRKSRHGR